VGSFGSLERIDLGFIGPGGIGNMRCHVAFSNLPLNGRVGASRTVPAWTEFRRTIAAFALLYDFVANPAFVGTTCFGHERAFFSLSNRCTNHFNHPLFGILMKKHKKTGKHNSPALNGQTFA